MKSFFYSTMLAAGLAVAANAQSLYSLASPAGSDVSLPLNYRASLQIGYDDNVNAVPSSFASHQESAYARFSVGAAASNWDARTQYSFDLHVGGIFYLESMDFGTKDVMSDINLRAALVHNLDSTLRYSASMGISYMPEPDYSSGITVGSRSGEYFHAFLDNNISKAWNNRFSTITGFNIATLQYHDSFSKIDNRDYYRLNQNFRYKWTMRSAASLIWRGEYADRRYGTDAVSNFVLAGYEYALTQYTNVSFQVGPQFKYTSNTGTDTYVFAMINVGHKLTDRSTLNIYLRREDESTNTYQQGRNYGSNATYRLGVSGAYKLNHVFTATAGVNYIDASYSKGQGGLTDRDSNTINCSVGLTYAVNRNLNLRLAYSYTHAKNSSFYTSDNKYDRNIYSLTASYQF